MSSENCQDFEVKCINGARVYVHLHLCVFACMCIIRGGQEVMAWNGQQTISAQQSLAVFKT